MKKLSVIIFAALACAIFSSCIVLPDAQGGYYTYPIGGDEIEYPRPDGSRQTIRQNEPTPNRPGSNSNQPGRPNRP